MKKALSLLLMLTILLSLQFSIAESNAPFSDGELRVAQTAVDDVNMRKEASAQSDLVARISEKKTLVIVINQLEDASGTVWYQAHYNGYNGYVRSDLVKLMDAVKSEETLATSRVTWVRRYADNPSTASVSSSGGSQVNKTEVSNTGSGLNNATPSPTTSPTPKPASPTSTPSPATRPPSSGNVWIPVNGGTKYHSNSGCSGMINPRNVTMDEAKSLGFDACKKCY